MRALLADRDRMPMALAKVFPADTPAVAFGPGIVHSAWKAATGTYGFIFVNLERHTSQSLTVEIDPLRYGCAPGGTNRYTRITGTDRETLAEETGPVTLSLKLEPRQVTLLELAMPSPGPAIADEPGNTASYA